MWSLFEFSSAGMEVVLLLAGVYTVYKAVDLLMAPLASIPGPWHTKLTGASRLIALLRGTSGDHAVDLHRTYGPIVRLDPTAVSVTDAGAVRSVLATHRFRKSEWYRVVQFGGERNVLSERDPVQYKSRKKMIAPAFSNVSMLSLEPIIMEAGVDRMISVIETKCVKEEPVDLFKLLMHMTLDVTGAVAFGGSFNMLSADAHPITSWLHGVMMLAVGRYMAGSRFSSLLLPGYARDETELIQHAVKMINQRRELRHPPTDILQSLIEAVDEDTGEGLSTTQLASEIITLLAMILLFEYPECLQRLLSELDESFPSLKEPVTHSKVINLPYLNAVLHETLRLRPPVSANLPRTVPPEGAVLCGQFVPGGTDIIISPYAVANDARNYAHPSIFNPDRWLVGSELASEMKQAYIPFSMGARACLGQNLAWLELRVTLAAILRRFTFELVPGQDLRPKVRALLEPAGAKLIVVVSKRTS
ncbi:cytochrome P450 [Thamnocephalis sphaerospora]|uniref:Cytochrome P450 n=1 Tax=Thamnocephalis sphaerospora TaxID=78915 RepID=A0A4P9XHY8_9FUNG|nr:cytochrome P450 [Thamnocephalis sphaerospora]|eukprot:RKP05288.1 cytochrome P450 [Thamnocephalis sphaerospora]